MFTLRIPFTLILFAIPLMALPQTRRIDSLKTLLPGDSETQHIDIFIELTREWIDINHDTSLFYGKKAFLMSKVSGDSMKIVKAGRIYAQVLRRRGQLDSAQHLFEKILPIAIRHAYRTEIKIILNALGVAYLHQSKYDEALKHFFHALRLREEDKDTWEVGIVLNNIGLVYLELHDYKRALHYYNVIIDLAADTGELNELDFTLLNKSICLTNLKNYAEARTIINKVLLDCGVSCSDELRIMAYQTLAMISFFEGDLDKARSKYWESYQLSKNMTFQKFHMVNLAGLIEIHTALNELRFAEHYFAEAEKLASTGSSYNLEMREIFFQLITAFQKLNDIPKVAFYQSKYIALKDNIFNEELTTNLMKIEADHLEKENKAKIEAQNKILALNEEVILRQKYLNVFIGIVALLLVIITILLVKSNRQKQRINSLLDRKVRERTQQLESNRDELQRACEERDRLINKISMDIRNSLATIKGLCLVGQKDIQDPVALQYMAKVDSAGDKLFDHIKQIKVAESVDVA